MSTKRKHSTDSENMPPPPVPHSKKRARVNSMNALRNISNRTLNNGNDNPNQINTSEANASQVMLAGRLSHVFDAAQENEALHGRGCEELNKLYDMMRHSDFMLDFINGVRQILQLEILNQYSMTLLRFLMKFLASLRCAESEEGFHCIIDGVVNFLIGHTSAKGAVRANVCKFIDMLTKSLSEDVEMLDEVHTKLTDCLEMHMHDTVINVRAQAAYALCRFQNPDDKNDKVLRIYEYHLSHDPAVSVRQAILSSIARNAITVPFIIERFSDIDEKVRRSAYLQMSSYPVRHLKLTQRQQFVKLGLNDHSEAVCKVVRDVLLPRWFQSYDKQYLNFLSALKLDDNYEEIQNFATFSKNTLIDQFKKDSFDNLLDQLPIRKNGDSAHTIPIGDLTVENIVYWMCLIEYVQKVDADPNDEDDRIHDVICELNVYIAYLLEFINSIELPTDSTESWEVEENEFKLLLLLDILMSFDLGDEVGRQSLKVFLSTALSSRPLSNHLIQKLVQCVEFLLPALNDRMKYIAQLLQSLIEPNVMIDICDSSVSLLLDEITDKKIKNKIIELKMRILDLVERNGNDSTNEGEEADAMHELSVCREIFARLLKSHSQTAANLAENLDESNAPMVALLSAKSLTPEWIKHCLNVFHNTVCSKKTTILHPDLGIYYGKLIKPNMRSRQMGVRSRALCCGVVCAMLNERISTEVSSIFCEQILHNQSIELWEIVIRGQFELMDRYGLAKYDTEEDNDFKWMDYMLHMLDTCRNQKIVKQVVIGYCRLILSEQFEDNVDILTRLLLKYYDRSSPPEITQIISVFLNTLIGQNKQACLHSALLPTVLAIHESAETEKFEPPASIINFVVEATVQKNRENEAHTNIARSFLNHMLENVDNKILLQLFATHLNTLLVDSADIVRNELKELAERVLNEPIQNKIIVGKIKKFVKYLTDGNHDRSTEPNQSPPSMFDIQEEAENEGAGYNEDRE